MQSKSLVNFVHHNVWTRRNFIRFMGLGTVASCASKLPAGQLLSTVNTLGAFPDFTPLAPSIKDELGLAKGLSYKNLISWDEIINDQGDRFGFNCDHIQWFPIPKSKQEFALCVNHESISDLFISGTTDKLKKTPEMLKREQHMVGVSIVHYRLRSDGEWEHIKHSAINRRIDATTPIPFAYNKPILNSTTAIGTFANCAGGKTPWNTYLTCEENYDEFYGEATFDPRGNRQVKRTKFYYAYGWDDHFKYPPEHYGFVVEINPLTGASKKLVNLGRFAHESATVTMASNGRCVVYMGDDHNDEHLYKFIASQPGSLEEGTLYVANFESQTWIPLDIELSPILKKSFHSQLDVLLRTREAAKLLGATPLDRPEDIEIHPVTKEVFVAATNRKPERPYGKILKLQEQDDNPLSMRFKPSVILEGGAKSGVSCPDNLMFDTAHNLWFTTDVYGPDILSGTYRDFGNNSLFVVPARGTHKGLPLRVANAPIDAEFTGPVLSPDEKCILVSVQHPGESTSDLKHPTSTWPTGNIPKPTVVRIYGPLLDQILGGVAHT